MRIITGLIIGLAMAGQAPASSFDVIGTKSDAKSPSVITVDDGKGVISLTTSSRSASIVAMGEPAAAEANTQIAEGDQSVVSESIVAMGEPAPAVSSELVAAISSKSSGKAPAVVIRGGLFGDAAPADVELNDASAAAAPGDGTTTTITPEGEFDANGNPVKQDAPAPDQAVSNHTPADDLRLEPQ